MRNLWIVAVVLVVVGCGKNRPAEGVWPAKLAGTENFSEDQWKSVLNAVTYLNEGAGKLIVDPNAPEDNYPIYFRLVAPTDATKQRAGLATVESDRCTIEISNVVYEPTHKEVLIPVVTHEIGHCAGLGHDPASGEIMYKTTGDMKIYSESALDRFFSSVLLSTGI